MRAGDGKPMLEGIRIIDMTSVLFGPYCTQTLADLGADVIKIESGRGDFTRFPGHAAKTPGMGGVFMTVNRGKRSVLLDLKSESDLKKMRDLLAGADVFIHNVRAGGIGRLGLDYAGVRAIKPDIVYAHLVGYGSEGRYGGYKAFDDTIQAASGITTLAGMVDGDPRPRFINSAIADKVGGLHAVYAVLAAIIHQMRTGEGQSIEVPMFESFTHFLLQEHLCDAAFDPPTGPIGYARQLDPERQPHPTKDGHVALAPYTDGEWVTLLTLLGGKELLLQPELADLEGRTRNFKMMYRAAATLTTNWTTQALLDACAEAHIAAMRVTPFGEIVSNDHLADVGFFGRDEHPTEGTMVRMRPPVNFEKRTRLNARHAPFLGEHNAELFT